MLKNCRSSFVPRQWPAGSRSRRRRETIEVQSRAPFCKIFTLFGNPSRLMALVISTSHSQGVLRMRAMILTLLLSTTIASAQADFTVDGDIAANLSHKLSATGAFAHLQSDDLYEVHGEDIICQAGQEEYGCQLTVPDESAIMKTMRPSKGDSRRFYEAMVKAGVPTSPALIGRTASVKKISCVIRGVRTGPMIYNCEVTLR
jgi:hypothetical protein